MTKQKGYQETQIEAPVPRTGA